MPKPKSDKNKLRPDAAEIAYRTMLEATGQAPRTVPGKGRQNPEAVARGSKGGKKGGKARAAKLDPTERSESAKKAALKRWETRATARGE